MFQDTHAIYVKFPKRMQKKNIRGWYGPRNDLDLLSLLHKLQRYITYE